MKSACAQLINFKKNLLALYDITEGRYPQSDSSDFEHSSPINPSGCEGLPIRRKHGLKWEELEWLVSKSGWTE